MVSREILRENLKFIRDDIDQFLNSPHSTYDIFQLLIGSVGTKIDRLKFDCGEVFHAECKDGSFRIKDK